MRSATRWARRLVAAAVLIGFLPLATSGCYGRFELTRKVYRFNGSISHDKWIEWLAFLVLVIVPIYGIAVFVDAIVANSLEFWTGRNPILAREGATRVVRAEDGSVAVMTLRADRSIAVVVTSPDGRQQEFSLVRESDAVAAFAPDGALLARVAQGEDRPALLAGELASATP